MHKKPGLPRVLLCFLALALTSAPARAAADRQSFWGFGPGIEFLSNDGSGTGFYVQIFGGYNFDSMVGVGLHGGWSKVPEQESYDNAFKVQWEAFLRHVAVGAAFPWSFAEGVKGIQLAELGLQSWKTRSWVDVPKLG